MMGMNTCIRNLLVPGLAALALAACGSNMSTLETAGTAVDQQPKLEFDVSGILVDSTFLTSGRQPHVEEELMVPLDRKVADWAKARLAAGGDAGVVKFNIHDASIVETALDRDAGIPGIPRAPQVIRFDSSIAASFEVLDAAGKRQAFGETRVTLSRTMAAHESNASRQQVLQKLSDAALRKFDTEMEKTVRSHARAYVR